MGDKNCDNCFDHSGQLIEIKNLKESVALVNQQQTAIVQGQHEIRESVAEQGRSLEYMEEKMDKMDHLTEAVLRMSMAIEASTDENKRSTEEMKQSMAKIFDVLALHGNRMDDHDVMIKDVQAIPSKNALKLVDVIKGIFITVFVGGFFALLWDKLVEIFNR